MDGRSYAATGWTGQANGPRDGEGYSGGGRLLQRGDASEPRCLLGVEPGRGPSMTRIGWWLVDTVSRMLEPDEREAVRGDFAESGETSAQALLNVLGLVARRQAAFWKDWRPWLALVGMVPPLGGLLGLVARRQAGGNAIYFL